METDLNPQSAGESASDLLVFAHELADVAEKAILPFFRQDTLVEDKAGAGDFDPVTEADRGAEAVMRALIETAYPHHGIKGEEFGDKPARGGHCWLLDPIDGTRSFITGLPIWGTLIGLARDDIPLIGLMNQPYTGERFWNSDQGAWFRGPAGTRQIRTRACPTPDMAILAATTPDMFSGRGYGRFRNLSANTRMTRFGGDCYLYCMLALGFIDIVAEAGLKPFDIAPLVPIIRAAGGVVTTWEGEDPSEGGEILAAGDPALHEAALKLLAV